MNALKTKYVLFYLFTFLALIPKIVAQGYEIDDMATDFSLKSTEGNLVSLIDYPKAKGFIVVFTNNTCPYAIAYEDRIIALDKKYASKGFPVIAIMPNNPKMQKGDSMDAMKGRAKAKGFTFPYLMDEDQKVFPQYGAFKTPEVYVLEKTTNGNKVKYMGAIDDNYQDSEAVKNRYVEDAVDALLSGNTIKLKKIRAIGCTIKT
ncbi:thioredoxin family protein [Bizionia argentinensis JUB59]|uniref:Thioredoxin family protein n=1 Tax=Bizionia argentinensis JUB59 TaxID=1046627 RepID=G2EE97_9FLAO|nr:thioredoxin family protein [Bizionia argentinensis]EGV43233.2 thioredoxin family protein [Bizionia argentinensis JUB59]